MNYFIAVETISTGPISDLAAALRLAFDGGADGEFKILVTHAPSYMVVFERNAVDDAEYVSKRMLDQDISAELGAMIQLGAELAEGGAGDVALPIIDVLKNGDAHVFDFSNGAMEYMATYEAEVVPELPKNVREVLSALVDYAKSATLENDELPEFVNTANRWLEATASSNAPASTSGVLEETA